MSVLRTNRKWHTQHSAAISATAELLLIQFSNVRFTLQHHAYTDLRNWFNLSSLLALSPLSTGYTSDIF